MLRPAYEIPVVELAVIEEDVRVGVGGDGEGALPTRWPMSAEVSPGGARG